MQCTRRHFLQITGSVAAAMGLGVTGVAIDRMLSGHASFSQWRALPGTTVDLTVDAAHPETLSVEIVARTESGLYHVDTLKGAATLSVGVPYIETADESFELIAVVRNDDGRYCQSEPVEVLTEPFMFGM